MKIGVLCCCKTKSVSARRADELYAGRVFRASAKYLRSIGCERLVILSALHHAVRDDEVIDPYNESLDAMGAAGRRHWAVVARAKLSNVLCEVSGRRRLEGVEVHAVVPAAYAAALDGIRAVTRHFAGLPQGSLYRALSLATGSSDGPSGGPAVHFGTFEPAEEWERQFSSVSGCGKPIRSKLGRRLLRVSLDVEAVTCPSCRAKLMSRADEASAAGRRRPEGG